ncbi:hypothetical protein K2173_016028 [Erythroxylum novogranatense]|uniref:Uncharacterized protein n=1 Tax=Erythroxylum novogranatense TaxID=1862640 RepID=A0AAV8SF14_9ROSI|nr:hypothetical protein K2173_016028 [Erythroxylum novogranatense]
MSRTHTATTEYKYKFHSVKSPRTKDDIDEVGEDTVAWLSVDDHTVAELMKFLGASSSEMASTTRVKFIDNPYSYLSLTFQSSSSCITINGNEESCGSSFSGSDSSVMASVDMVGIGMVVRGVSWVAREEKKDGREGVGFVNDDEEFDCQWDDDCVMKFSQQDCLFDFL